MAAAEGSEPADGDLRGRCDSFGPTPMAFCFGCAVVSATEAVGCCTVAGTTTLEEADDEDEEDEEEEEEDEACCGCCGSSG